MYSAWKTFASDYALGDYRIVTHATHGRRLYDTLKEYCRIQDEAQLQVANSETRRLVLVLILFTQAEIDRFENEVILGGPVALPGAKELVSQVSTSHTRHQYINPHIWLSFL